ncbi:MAG: hypothetical protein CL942_08715 [Desulfovibrio sp.]|nr:hypothetical protein [Desulfovibrio sp.]|tara:strand:- start:14964 stop:15218 length:255 start_codon:yes stop_codon:yes gene_type:complete
MKYTAEISKKVMKTITIEVPDHVTEEDVKEFTDEAIDDLFDLEDYQGTVKWQEDDFFDSPVDMTLVASDDGHEYELDGFGQAEA